MRIETEEKVLSMLGEIFNKVMEIDAKVNKLDERMDRLEEKVDKHMEEIYFVLRVEMKTVYKNVYENKRNIEAVMSQINKIDLDVRTETNVVLDAKQNAERLVSVVENHEV